MNMKGEKIDIIVGIPSLNEADNIAFVAHQISLGLMRYFPLNSAMIINVDNNSKDGTKDAFLESETGSIPKRYVSTEEDVVGKGNNMRNFFIEVAQLNAKAVVVVDADLRSITPEWVKILATPILDGHDYASPIYSRNEYDGTITNNIIYPLLNSIFKANIRQPIGGEFSFSPQMAKYWLEMEWDDNIKQYGIDIFMTTAALLNGFKVCQVVLGSKIHKPSAPKLGQMFTQVVNTIFSCISRHKDVWMNNDCANDSPILGNVNYEEPQGLSIDYKSIKNESFKGFSKMDTIISEVLSPYHYNKIRNMYLAGKWNIRPKLWTRILYDFIIAYEVSENKSEVVEALKPLYFARAVSFYKETLDMDHHEAEEEIVKQAGLFRENRGYLIKKFKSIEKEKQISYSFAKQIGKFGSFFKKLAFIPICNSRLLLLPIKKFF